MNDLEMDVEPEVVPRKPRTTTVIVLLAAFAIIASWLGVYAVTNALVAAEVISAWPPDSDPRPVWMLNTFVTLFLGFAFIGISFRWLSNRQMRRIDAIAEAE